MSQDDRRNSAGPIHSVGHCSDLAAQTALLCFGFYSGGFYLMLKDKGELITLCLGCYFVQQYRLMKKAMTISDGAASCEESAARPSLRRLFFGGLVTTSVLAVFFICGLVSFAYFDQSAVVISLSAMNIDTGKKMGFFVAYAVAIHICTFSTLLMMPRKCDTLRPLAVCTLGVAALGLFIAYWRTTPAVACGVMLSASLVLLFFAISTHRKGNARRNRFTQSLSWLFVRYCMATLASAVRCRRARQAGIRSALSVCKAPLRSILPPIRTFCRQPKCSGWLAWLWGIAQKTIRVGRRRMPWW